MKVIKILAAITAAAALVMFFTSDAFAYENSMSDLHSGGLEEVRKSGPWVPPPPRTPEQRAEDSRKWRALSKSMRDMSCTMGGGNPTPWGCQKPQQIYINVNNRMNCNSQYVGGGRFRTNCN